MYKIRKIVFHEHPVLKNLSLNFCDSEGKCIDTIIFAGENGTGKSTIINSIYMLVSRTANFEADVEFEKDGNPFQITYEYRVLQDGMFAYLIVIQAVPKLFATMFILGLSQLTLIQSA